MGPVKSNFMTAAGFPEQLQEASIQRMTKSSPIGLFGKPEDIANAVAFLASEDSAFMTGSNVVIDGGVVWSNS